VFGNLFVSREKEGETRVLIVLVGSEWRL
jgi:hypothetical protein